MKNKVSKEVQMLISYGCILIGIGLLLDNLLNATWLKVIQFILIISGLILIMFGLFPSLLTKIKKIFKRR